MTVWARLTALAGRAGRRSGGVPAPAPVDAGTVQRPSHATAPTSLIGPDQLSAPHPARAIPVPVISSRRWRAKREPGLAYDRMTNAERARYLRQRPECELCRRRPSAAVDHDLRTGTVRGALCRSCNSWLGSMEAALRVPQRQMQTQAAYLHWRFEAGGPAALRWYLGELAYLDTTVGRYAEGLLEVRRLLSLPYVYWTDRSLLPAAREWTKIGPLVDVDEAERHLRRLRSRPGPPPVVLIALEPDDGVNSPYPRGLVRGVERDPGSQLGLDT